MVGVQFQVEEIAPQANVLPAENVDRTQHQPEGSGIVSAIVIAIIAALIAQSLKG